GAPEEVVRGLGVPLDIVERHTDSRNEVRAACLFCKPPIELLVHDPFQLDEPLVEGFFGGCQWPRRLPPKVHGNRGCRSPKGQWHSTRRLDLAEVVRRGFVVSLSEVDAAQEQG